MGVLANYSYNNTLRNAKEQYEYLFMLQGWVVGGAGRKCSPAEVGTVYLKHIMMRRRIISGLNNESWGQKVF